MDRRSNFTRLTNRFTRSFHSAFSQPLFLPAILSPEIASARGVRAAGMRHQITAHRGRNAQATLHILVRGEVAPGKQERGGKNIQCQME